MTFVFNDGATDWIGFENGEQMSPIRLDHNDWRPWPPTRTQYEYGAPLTSSLKDHDDGVVSTFDGDEVRVREEFFDGSDAGLWGTRKKPYNPADNVSGISSACATPSPIHSFDIG